MLAGAARGIGEGKFTPEDWIEVQVGMPFQIGGGHGRGWHQGVCISYRFTRIPEKEVGL